MLAFFSSLAILVQTLLQTTFILDASCRYSCKSGNLIIIEICFLLDLWHQRRRWKRSQEDKLWPSFWCATWPCGWWTPSRLTGLTPTQSRQSSLVAILPGLSSHTYPCLLLSFTGKHKQYKNSFWELRIKNYSLIFAYSYVFLKYGTFQVSFHCLPFWNMEEIIQVWKRNICISTLYVLK